jgi:transcriptional regulator with XRE-family HTH domain
MEKKLLIGKRIKSLRKQLQITQDQLAEKIQLSPKYLSNIERGKENPTLDTLLKLSQALNVEPWEMFLLDSELPSKQVLKDKIAQLVSEASDERLRLIVRLLQAAVH